MVPITDPTTAPYERRYKIVFKTYFLFIGMFVLGSWFIIPNLPHNLACALKDTPWIVALWPSNRLNIQVLSEVPDTTLDVCTLIPSVSWAALVGIFLLFWRIIFEWRFNERRRVLGLKGPAILSSVAIWSIFSGIIFDIPEIIHNKSLFAPNFYSWNILATLKLSLLAFSVSIFLAESYSILLIYVRSYLDARE